MVCRSRKKICGLTMQLEYDFDERVHLDRLAVEQRWGVTPLPDGLNGGFGQRACALDQPQVHDIPLPIDHCSQFDRALFVPGLGLIGVLGPNLIQESSRLSLIAHGDSLSFPGGRGIILAQISQLPKPAIGVDEECALQ